MIKRLLKILLFPILLITVVFEGIYHCIRWIITGKEIPEYPFLINYVYSKL